MTIAFLLGVLAVALLVAGCVFVLRHPRSAADERRADEQMRARAEMDISDVQRQRGYGGH